MGAREHLAEVLDCDARVERRRLKAAVPEQLLHVADVGTASQQMSRTGVPQHVRRDAEADRRAVPLHHRLQADHAQTAAVTGEEERGVDALHELGPRIGEVRVEGQCGAALDGHHTILLALAAPHEEHALSQVEV